MSENPDLSTLDPVLSDTEMVFCWFPGAMTAEKLALSPVAFFDEEAGVSLIIAKEMAERHGIPFNATFRCITLGLHSSLESIGLTAAVSGRLALHGISANVVAAYHHDHIFVPARDADRALRVLRDLQTGSVSRQ
jgi:uncharacterized protein